jgi:hypothetical protein
VGASVCACVSVPMSARSQEGGNANEEEDDAFGTAPSKSSDDSGPPAQKAAGSNKSAKSRVKAASDRSSDGAGAHSQVSSPASEGLANAVQAVENAMEDAFQSSKKTLTERATQAISQASGFLGAHKEVVAGLAIAGPITWATIAQMRQQSAATGTMKKKKK